MMLAFRRKNAKIAIAHETSGDGRVKGAIARMCFNFDCAALLALLCRCFGCGC